MRIIFVFLSIVVSLPLFAQKGGGLRCIVVASARDESFAESERARGTEAVDSVLVSVWRAGGDTVYGFTDANGDCRIRGIPPGTCIARFYKPGFPEEEVRGVIISDNKTTYLQAVRLRGIAPPRQGIRLIPAKSDSSVKSCVPHFDSTLNRSYYTYPDSMPVYAGGEDSLLKVIVKNIRYPGTHSDIQGTVWVSLIIEADGSVSNIRIRKSLHPWYDSESLRVVKLLAAWTPGKCNGVAVPVERIIPMRFVIH